MKPIAILALAAGLALFAFSPGRADDSPARSEFHYSYPLTANGMVALDDDRGNVRVMGWNANRVQVDATLCAPSADQLAGMKVDVDSSPATVTIQTIYPREAFLQRWWQLSRTQGCSNQMEVAYVVHVPAYARVKLSTKSGDINVQTLNAALSARSISGDIQAQAVGDAALSTVSGDVTVTHGRGICAVEETSGRAILRDVTGSVSSSSVSGDVDLTGVAGKAVVSTTSGNITARGYRGVARFHSVSGDVDLTLVRAGSMSISASTVHGEIESEVPLRPQAPIDVQTVSGDIRARFL